MSITMRVLMSLIGVASIMAAFQHWFALETVSIERGMATDGIVGRANFRADVGGLFLAIGVFQLLAAIKYSGHWAMAAAVLIGAALTGRIISLGLDGVSDAIWLPITVEAISLIIALTAWQIWKNKTPEGL